MTNSACDLTRFRVAPKPLTRGCARPAAIKRGDSARFAASRLTSYLLTLTRSNMSQQRQPNDNSSRNSAVLITFSVYNNNLEDALAIINYVRQQNLTLAGPKELLQEIRKFIEKKNKP
jgi:alkyl sulfatase BDS1-like metallo-beta-lactamase superfamily hydrolase